MRNLDTPVKQIRHKIFTEVAKVGFESKDETLIHDIEAIPYNIVEERAQYRESIYRERAVASERVRLAMGLSLRPENRAVHLTSGLEASNIDEKYYEPPLMQVIPSACAACPPNKYIVSDMCRGCVAHPCMQACPKGAISMINGKSCIDQDKCIKCGQCSKVCPYGAIYERRRPCEIACGVGAIGTDYAGRAQIDPEKCVSCGMCMVSCPFGAIADKSQIYQLIKAMNEGNEVIAILAPAFVGQFGPKATPNKIKAALLDIGFSDVWEVAVGADAGALEEAEHYAHGVATGEVPFLLTSCCPSWAMLGKKYFPEVIDQISNALTPMVATARAARQTNQNAKIVFVGPCVAKKLEASRKSVRSEVDFVITFEELAAMFEAKEIDFNTYDKEVELNDAFGAGRGYAVASGVASAIEACVKEYYPGTDIKIDHVEGLAECRKMLLQAKAGKKNGYLIEGMGCPGGCVAGAGTNIPVNKANVQVKKFVKEAEAFVPPETAKY